MTQRLHDTIRRLEAERDALAAQVTQEQELRLSYIGLIGLIIDIMHKWRILFDWEQVGLGQIDLDNLDVPKQLAKYLAAQRVCEILMAQYAPSLKHAGPLVEAMDEWRKAGE